MVDIIPVHIINIIPPIIHSCMSVTRPTSIVIYEIIINIITIIKRISSMMLYYAIL